MQFKLLPGGKKTTKAFKSQVLFRERTRSHPSRRPFFFLFWKADTVTLPAFLHSPSASSSGDSRCPLLSNSVCLLLQGQSFGVSTHCLSISDSRRPQGAQERHLEGMQHGRGLFCFLCPISFWATQRSCPSVCVPTSGSSRVRFCLSAHTPALCCCPNHTQFRPSGSTSGFWMDSPFKASNRVRRKFSVQLLTQRRNSGNMS